MKLIQLISIFCLGSLATLHAQEYSLKYGEITNNELNMKVYPKDTAATAVILYEDGKTTFDLRSGSGFVVITNYAKKIKILKQEGIEYATITIPYYFRTNSDREFIAGLEVTAYNLENGKTVKTKLDKKYLFEEDLNGSYKQIKFTIPNIKVGSVIEYKYKRSIDFSSDLDDWEIQTTIPVLKSTYEVTIPEFFNFSVDTKGYEYIETKETQENQQFNVGVLTGGSASLLSSSSRAMTFVATDVPAMKDENFVWCVNDYTSGIRFELNGYNIPGVYSKSFSHTWEDLDKALSDDSDLSKNIKTSNPFKDEVKALVSNTTDNKEKIELIYKFIKNNIRWDKSYAFWGNNAKESVKKGTGNNAQINIILMSALEDAGIKAYPVLISRRKLGRLPYTHPSLEKLNTFIVAAETTDSTTVYLDGSAEYGGLNILPSDLQVDRGYIFDPEHIEKWVDLTHLTKNEQRASLVASIDNDGNLKGSVSTTYINQKAYSYKASITDAKDSTEYIDNLQNTSLIKVDSVFIKGKDNMSNMVSERMLFTKKIESSGDFMYINPMIFMHISKNNFTQTDRKLPIEFDYPYIYTTTMNITIPDNYEIVEMPKSQRMALNENHGNCIYQIGQQGNNIQVRYRFEMNQTLYPFTDYPSIRDFYGQVATKNNEMIVLKKKQS